MNIGTAENPVKIIIDTNIIISGIGFGGKPRKILQLILDNKIKAVISPILLAELEDVITKKFPKLANNFELINKKLRKKILVVKPKDSINVLKADPDDNKVLEAAVEGKCSYIVTGDKELLDLTSYKNIKIITADQFLDNLEEIEMLSK